MKNDYTRCSVSGSLWTDAQDSNTVVLSCPDKVALPQGGERNVSGVQRSLTSYDSGSRLNGMVNICELRINIVKYNKPKMLDTGFNQKGEQSDNLLNFGVTRTIALPVKLQYLTHSFVTYTEHGKPVSLPANRESKPQGKPMGVRVWDCRKSERHPVMGWIGVETSLHTKVSRLLRKVILYKIVYRTFKSRKANERK